FSPPLYLFLASFKFLKWGSYCKLTGDKRDHLRRDGLHFFILPIRLLNPDSLPPIFSPHRSVLPLLQHRSLIHQSNHHPSSSFHPFVHFREIFIKSFTGCNKDFFYTAVCFFRIIQKL